MITHSVSSRTARRIAVRLLVFGLLLMVVASAYTFRLQEVEQPSLLDLLMEFLALGGAAAVIAALVNIGKVVGLGDGQAPKVSLVLNLIGFVALVALRVFVPQVDIGQVDTTAQGIAAVLVAVLGLATQLGLTRLFHEKALKGMPLIGKSHSQEKARAPLQPAGKT